MQKFLISLALAGFGYFVLGEPDPVDRAHEEATGSDSLIQEAYQNRTSDLQVEGSGVVARILPDDTEGDRHQRFILRLGSGQTLLVAHNIDLAPRISSLSEGDRVEFFGEYEWNEQGGVIHWAHGDPRGQQVKCFASLLTERRPLFSRSDGSRCSRQQGRTQAFFKPGYAPADTALSLQQAPRCGKNAAQFNDGGERSCAYVIDQSRTS